MTQKKIFKIIISILIAITLFTAFTQNSFALGGREIDSVFDGKTDKSDATNTVTKILGATINLFQIFGTGFAIIMLVVLVIKWIGASPSGKAEIAKSSRYYIIGAIFIFAAVGLLQIVKTFTKKSIVDQI